MFCVDKLWGLSLIFSTDFTAHSPLFLLKLPRRQIRRTFRTMRTHLIYKDFFENFSEHRKNIWNIKDLRKNIIKTSTYKPP